MSSVNLRNVSDEELIAEMKKRFVIVGGFHYKEWLTIDGIDKYSYEELNHYLDTEAHIDGDEFYQEHREALLEKFGDEYLETKCGCKIIINSREHDECRCDGSGENWICSDCYDGEYNESEYDETEVEVWNNENQYICREVGNIYVCADCNEAKELEEDKLCHYCYHYSLDNPADCWCGKEDPNDEDEDA